MPTLFPLPMALARPWQPAGHCTLPFSSRGTHLALPLTGAAGAGTALAARGGLHLGGGRGVGAGSGLEGGGRASGTAKVS